MQRHRMFGARFLLCCSLRLHTLRANNEERLRAAIFSTCSHSSSRNVDGDETRAPCCPDHSLRLCSPRNTTKSQKSTGLEIGGGILRRGDALLLPPASSSSLLSADLNKMCRYSSMPPSWRTRASSAPGAALQEGGQDSVTIDVSDCDTKLEESIMLKRDPTAFGAEILERFLQKHKGLQPKDAELISKNCPAFISKLVESAAGYEMKEDYSNTEERALMEQWLAKTDVNELEPFLESIGLHPSKIRDVLPLLQLLPLNGDRGLLRSVEILESAGIPRKTLWNVLESNKRLLTLTPSELRATMDFLEGLGVTRGNDMVQLIQDSFFLTDNLGTLQNLEKFGVQKRVIAEILKSDNRQEAGLGIPVGNFKDRVDFLLGAGLSKAEVTQGLKFFPQLLHQRLDNLRRKIQFFDDIGLERERVAKIIARWPLVFRRSVETKLRPKIELLQSLGVGSDGIAKILARYPELGSVSLQDNLRQKVAFFEMNGLTGKRLVKLMTSHPRALTLSLSDLNKKLDFLVQKGFVPGSVEMIRALGVCITISVESMEARFMNLESLGFQVDAGHEMVKGQPAILTLSEKCIRDKVRYLQYHMNRHPEEIVRCPSYLLYSLELRIKPRHRVLSLLRSEGILREETYSLNTIMIMSQKKFMDRFVISLGKQSPQVIAAYYEREYMSSAIPAPDIREQIQVPQSSVLNVKSSRALREVVKHAGTKRTTTGRKGERKGMKIVISP